MATTIGKFTPKVKQLSKNPSIGALINKEVIEQTNKGKRTYAVKSTPFIFSEAEFNQFVELGAIEIVTHEPRRDREYNTYRDIDASHYERLFETSEMLKMGPNEFWKDLPKHGNLRDKIGSVSEGFWRVMDFFVGRSVDKFSDWAFSQKLTKEKRNNIVS